MTVVFVGSNASVFVSRTQAELVRRGLQVSILDPYVLIESSVDGNNIFNKLSRAIARYRNVRRLISQYPHDSVAMVHFLGFDCVWLIPLLKTRFRRVVGIAYGSDILRRRRVLDPFLGYGLKQLDAVVATNFNVLDELELSFPILADRSLGILRFGLPVLDELRKLDGVTSLQSKARLGFDPTRRLASLGYAASPGQRQLEQINFFVSRLAEFDDLDFVVPIQYGSKQTMDEVSAHCSRVNSQIGAERFLPLTEFHSPDRAALMRLATDVLINHSVTDAFSGTVMEVVYAGNLVLAGSHLPYDRMPGFGTAILPYQGLEDVASALHKNHFFEHLRTAKNSVTENRAALCATSTWDAVLPDWIRVLGVKGST